MRRLAVGVGYALLLAALGWAAGFSYFVRQIPDAVEDSRTPTDAIVVLTGGGDRLAEGLRLLNAGLAARLFVSGVPPGIDLADLLAELPPSIRPANASALRCCVVLGHAAGNTAGNAAETVAWLAAEDMGSLRLVTADYHIPRSLLEFRAAAAGATILPHPVFPQETAGDPWRTWPRTANLLLREYMKYALALARAALFAPTPAVDDGSP